MSNEKDGLVDLVDATVDAMQSVVETTQAAVSPIESFIVGALGTDVWNSLIVVSFIVLSLFLLFFHTSLILHLRELAKRTKSPVDDFFLQLFSQRALLLGMPIIIGLASLVIIWIDAKGILHALSQVNHMLFALAILRVVYLILEYHLTHRMPKAKKRRVTAQLRIRGYARILLLIYVIYTIAILGIKMHDWLDLNISPAWFPFIIAGVIVPAVVWFKNSWNLSGYHLGYTGNRLKLEDGTYATIIEHGQRQVQHRRDDGTVGFTPTKMLAESSFDITTTMQKRLVEYYFLLDFSSATQDRLAVVDMITRAVEEIEGTNNVISCRYVNPKNGYDQLYLKYPIRVGVKRGLDRVQNEIYVAIQKVLNDSTITLASEGLSSI